MKKKQYFLLLLSIPMYAAYLYFRSLFKEADFLWSDVLFLSAFTLSAVLLAAIDRLAVKVAACASVQAAWFTLCGLHAFEITTEQTVAYIQICLPALLLTALYPIETALPAAKSKGAAAGKKKKQPRQAEKKAGNAPLLIFLSRLLIAAFAIYTVAYLLSAQSLPGFALDRIGCCDLLLLCFLGFCMYRLGSAGLSAAFSFALLLFLSAAANTAAYILLFHARCNDALPFLFAPFAAILLFFDRDERAKAAVFQKKLRQAS